MRRADPNHRYWSSARIVGHYSVQTGLTPPEEAFLASVPDLAASAVLDVGVGGGRTAASIGPRASSYRAVDYSAPLIEACRRRFDGTDLALRFDVADARDLSRYPDASFDVVLFGSNGLDYVDHDDRMRSLAELRRVCRPDGRLGVSSHDITNIPRVLSLADRAARLAEDRSVVRLPLALIRHLPRRAASILRNPPAAELARRRWVFLPDDSAVVRPIRTFHVAAEEMVDELGATGFRVVDVFTPQGRRLAPGQWGASGQPWLFWSVRPTRG